MAKLTESDKQRLEKAKNLYAIIAPHRMDHQNECPSDMQLVLGFRALVERYNSESKWYA